MASESKFGGGGGGEGGGGGGLRGEHPLLTRLRTVESVEDLKRLVDDLVADVRGLSGLDQRELRRMAWSAMKDARRRVSAAARDPRVPQLLKQYHSEDDDDVRAQLGKSIAHIYGKTADGVEIDSLLGKLFGRLESAFAEVSRRDAGTGRSSRAKRARQASTLYTKYAGMPVPRDARLDREGNPAGLEYDLGREGAFDGLHVVIHQQYPFKIGPVVAALEKKGFRVTVFDAYTLPKPEPLKRLLADANQFWLISHQFTLLNADQIQVIQDAWEDGMGLYVFGDNEPFYMDANRVLSKILGIRMSGNVPGGKVVGCFDPASGGGFRQHLVATGLCRLYEGVTLATFKKEDVERVDGEEILRDHEGNLIVFGIPSQDGKGPVICDGAFTKLFCSWDEAGSARFVRNCACYLAAIDGPSCEVVESAGAPELTLDGAPKFMCDITFEEGPVAVFATDLPDADANTTDAVLNDPLGVGARNSAPLGNQVYALDVARRLFDAREDPFRRVPLHAAIPVVDLDHDANRAVVGDILCQVYLGGRRMPLSAFMIHLAVCDHKLADPDVEHPEVWRFQRDQILCHLQSTADFTAVGPKMPIADAMCAFLGATGEMEQLRKSFATICMMARIVSEDRKLPIETVFVVARRRFIKTVVSSCVLRAKQFGNKWGLDGLVYECVYGVPLQGSSRLVTHSAAAGLLGGDDVVREESRLMAALASVSPEELPPLLDNPGLTAVVLRIMDIGHRELAGMRVESALEAVAKGHLVKKLWTRDGDADVDGAAVIEAADKRLSGFFEPTGVHLTVPPFATCYGPSVYLCTCGLEFGDPKAPVSRESVEEMKKRRAAHFAEVYGAEDGDGRPSGRSGHVSLHRAVQVVLAGSGFREKKERTADMEAGVVAYLKKASKGNIHDRGIGSDVRRAIDSYLECRARGDTEPFIAGIVADNMTKAQVEQHIVFGVRPLPPPTPPSTL